MTGRLSGLTLNRDGSQNVVITVNADFSSDYDNLKDCDVSVEIKKFSKKRSLDANNFLWHLCSEIAKRSSKFSNASKIDIYKEAIRAKGEFEPLLIRMDAVERFKNRWADKGDGWFADIIDDYKTNYKIVHAYYGSSTYTSAAMSRLIDYVVAEAEELGIPTITDKERDRMLSQWGLKHD